MPKKKKINISGIFSHIKAWHIAVVSLAFFMVIAYVAGKQVTSFAGEVENIQRNTQQNSQQIEEINLWRLNEKIWKLEDVYTCEGTKCRDKMPKEVWKDYRDKLEQRETDYGKMKGAD